MHLAHLLAHGAGTNGLKPHSGPNMPPKGSRTGHKKAKALEVGHKRAAAPAPAAAPGAEAGAGPEEPI